MVRSIVVGKDWARLWVSLRREPRVADNGLGVGNWWQAIADFDTVVVHGFDDGEPDCTIAC